MGWSKLVDLERDDDAKLDVNAAFPDLAPDYPMGLRICLCRAELDKLGLDTDCNIGDMIDMRCFGEVTSVSKDRVEIQIQKMAVENEMTESEEG